MTFRAAVLAAALVSIPAGRAAALDPSLLGTTADESRFDGEPVLSPEQSAAFRAWMARIVDAQFRNGPTPRWHQKDCAGLVRFAVAEALRAHDAAWLRANGVARPVPPEVALTAAQAGLRHSWLHSDGTRSAFVPALELVQQNAVFVSRDPAAAKTGDLLLFDQGDDQHLMISMGSWFAWHTGTAGGADDGLRAVSLRDLRRWKDTRWRPDSDNPSFLGVFRLRFLSR